jgi:hypothetical protein
LSKTLSRRRPNVVTMRPSRNMLCTTPPAVLVIVFELLPPPALSVVGRGARRAGSGA